MAKKPVTTWKADWEAVEADYRSSVLSIREIAKRHGVSDTMVRKKANALDWKRPLAHKVREEIDEQLLRDAADDTAAGSHPPGSQGQRAPTRARDADIIERAAALGVEVVRSHRANLSAMHSERRRLMTKLAELAKLRAMTAEERQAAGIPEDAQFEALSLADEVAILEGLARVMYRLVPLERQAYALDAKNDPNTPANGQQQNVFVVKAKTVEPVNTRPMTEEELAADLDT